MANGGAPSVVTFLFTDIVGSTQLTETLGDEGAQEILRIHNSLLRAEVARHGGSETKAMGDGFMITFQSPTSAVACAGAIQQVIARHNQEQPARAFAVRIGLNAGEAIQEEGDFFGAAVIVAARIAALAEGGEILTSEAVKQLGQGMRGVEYKFKGEFHLKGFREPYRIFEVVSGLAERPAVAALRRPRFVGREEELADLQRCLEQVLAGSGLFLLLAGEAGVGKTRLVEELASHARSRGVRVFRGHCFETEGAPPYMPFVEILRDYIQGRPDDVLLDELGDDAPQIARLAPELARHIPIDGNSAPLPPEQERYRLFESVRRWLEGMASRRPMLLVIEDIQWVESASCVLLRHLASTLPTAPIFILATCREEDIEASPPLTAALAEFGRVQAYRRVRLSGLSAPAIRELLAAMGRGDPPEGLVAALFQATAGNPFFVAELINHLDTEGMLLDRDGQWQANLSPETWDVPAGVRAVTQRRLGRLGEETRKVLNTASVAGREFSYDLLEAVSDVPADTLLDSLDEAIRMGMIEETGESVASFRFSHQLSQQTLYDELSDVRRRRLHLRVGEALEMTTRTEPEQVANHLYRTGGMAPPEKTRRYLTMAGDKASRAAGWERAASYYERALELTPAKEERAQLLRRLGEARSGFGDWEGAVASWQEAMDAFEKLEDREAAGWIGFFLRKLHGFRGQFDEASEVGQRSLRVVGDDDTEVRSRILAQGGFIRSAFGERPEAERLLTQSMEIAERLDSAAAKGFSAFIRGMHCLNYCRLAEAADWLDKSVTWSLAGDDLATASQVSSSRRHVLLTLGKLAEAERSMDEEERLARKAGSFLALCDTKWISSEIACLRGDLAKADALSGQLLDLIEASQAESGTPGALMNRAYIRFLQGDWQEFEELLSEAISSHDRMSAAPIDDPRPVLMLLRALAGREEEARAMLPEVGGYFDFDEPWTTSLGEARTTLGAALAVLGEKEAAADLYQPLKEWTDVSGYVLTGASSIPQLVSRVLGMVAHAAGRPDEAAEHFRAAVRRARELGAATELAEASYWYARLLLERGGTEDLGHARDLLAEAGQIWERTEMPKQLERARRLQQTAAGD
ncbi:MAG: AAA family ATPase [Dehalococcoidia bacterium]